MLNNYSTHGVIPPLGTKEPQTLPELFMLLDPQSQWAVEKLQWGHNEGNQTGGNVAAAILRGDAKAVSDGSYKDGHGTSAFILKGDSHQKAIRGRNTIPGRKEEQCAYRSELGGVLGIVTVLEGLCQFYNLEEGKIRIGLDGDSVIKKLRSPFLPNPKASHYDLLLDCKSRIKALPIKVEFQWIEGHQDDNKGDHGLLDWWARQNINMDRAAKQHWKDTKQSTPPNLPFKHEQWAISIQGQKLSSFDKDLVYERVASADVIKYWKEKKSNPIEDEVFDSMNWPASKVAIKERPQGKQRFFYKFATGSFACGQQMFNRGEWPHDKCPRCGEVDENNVRICSATLMEPLCYTIDIDQLCIPQQCAYQCGSKIEMTL